MSKAASTFGTPSSNDTTVAGLISAGNPASISRPPEIVSKSLSDIAAAPCFELVKVFCCDLAFAQPVKQMVAECGR
jgi:hypothetical protein